MRGPGVRRAAKTLESPGSVPGVCPRGERRRELQPDPNNPASLATGRIDAARVDATTEEDIAAHSAADEAEAMQDAARFVRRVRRRLGLTQAQFSSRIDVPLETIRNWEQGKRSPTGAAKALLKVLDRAPEAALAALH